MKKYQIYYIDKSNRIQCMLICSLKRKIDWCEQGLKLASWKYNFINKGEAESINEIFKNYSKLNIDKRRKNQTRTINIGDIIMFDGESWIITAFGFLKVPYLLWDKINK